MEFESSPGHQDSVSRLLTSLKTNLRPRQVRGFLCPLVSRRTIELRHGVGIKWVSQPTARFVPTLMGTTFIGVKQSSRSDMAIHGLLSLKFRVYQRISTRINRLDQVTVKASFERSLNIVRAAVTSLAITPDEGRVALDACALQLRSRLCPAARCSTTRRRFGCPKKLTPLTPPAHAHVGRIAKESAMSRRRHVVLDDQYIEGVGANAPTARGTLCVLA